MQGIAADNQNPCQACGACCSYSQNWPRFTTEDDAALDLIPERFVNERLSGLRRDDGKLARCLRRHRFGKIFVVDLTLDGREGVEGFGRKRARLATAVRCR